MTTKEVALRFRDMDQEIIRNEQKKQFFEKVKDSKGNVHTNITVKVPIKRKGRSSVVAGNVRRFDRIVGKGGVSENG